MVELGHHAAASLPGGSEFLVTFLQRPPQVENLLAEAVSLFADSSDIGCGAEAGAFADAGAEQFGQLVFEAAGVVFEAAVALAEVGVVGQQRPAADSTCPGRAVRRWGLGSGDDGGAQVRVAVDE